MKKVSQKQFNDFIRTSLVLNLFGAAGALLASTASEGMTVTAYIVVTHTGANLVAILCRGFFVNGQSGIERG